MSLSSQHRESKNTIQNTIKISWFQNIPFHLSWESSFMFYFAKRCSWTVKKYGSEIQTTTSYVCHFMDNMVSTIPVQKNSNSKLHFLGLKSVLVIKSWIQSDYLI